MKGLTIWLLLGQIFGTVRHFSVDFRGLKRIRNDFLNFLKLSIIQFTEHTFSCNINFIDLNLTVTEDPKTKNVILNGDIVVKSELDKVSVNIWENL